MTTAQDVQDEPITCCGEVREDPLVQGRTSGGLDVIGGLVCAGCGKQWVAKGVTRPREAWSVASSGLSVDVGITRLRAERGSCTHDEVTALMARIARLPGLELKVAGVRRLITELLGREHAEGCPVDDRMPDDECICGLYDQNAGLHRVLVLLE